MGTIFPCHAAAVSGERGEQVRFPVAQPPGAAAPEVYPPLGKVRNINSCCQEVLRQRAGMEIAARLQLGSSGEGFNSLFLPGFELSRRFLLLSPPLLAPSLPPPPLISFF